MLHLWPVIEDWQGMRILLPIYTIFEGIKWLITSFLADQAVNLGINWKKPVDPLENHLIPPKNHINSHFFINPFSVWLDWPEMQHLYPYWASFVSNGCSKWLPKYYFLAIWLQTLFCPVQTWQSMTQNGGKCQYLAPNPPWSSPDQVPKMAEKHIFFLVHFNPDPWPVQIKLAGTQ